MDNIALRVSGPGTDYVSVLINADRCWCGQVLGLVLHPHLWRPHATRGCLPKVGIRSTLVRPLEEPSKHARRKARPSQPSDRISRTGIFTPSDVCSIPFLVLNAAHPDTPPDNFKPPSIDSTKPGTIEVKRGQDSTSVIIEHPSSQVRHGWPNCHHSGLNLWFRLARDTYLGVLSILLRRWIAY